MSPSQNLHEIVEEFSIVQEEILVAPVDLNQEPHKAAYRDDL
jgi:hypothetical protein